MLLLSATIAAGLMWLELGIGVGMPACVADRSTVVVLVRCRVVDGPAAKRSSARLVSDWVLFSAFT